MNGKPSCTWLQIFLASNLIPATAAVNSFTQALSSLAQVSSDRALTIHSRSSDFLPAAPLMLNVCARWRDWQSHMHYTYILEGEPTEKWFLFLVLCWVVLKHTRGLLGTPLDQAKQSSLEVANSITYFWMNSPSYSFCSEVLYSGFLKSHFQINHSHINLCFRVCFRKIHMKILNLLFI